MKVARLELMGKLQIKWPPKRQNHFLPKIENSRKFRHSISTNLILENEILSSKSGIDIKTTLMIITG